MEDLFLYLAKSCGLLVVFLVFYHLLLKKDTSFKNNRVFLLGGIIASAVLPAVYFTQKIIVEAVEPNFSMVATDFPVAQVIAEEPAISGYQILLAVYFCGVVFMLGRMMFQLISLQRILRNGKHIKKDGFKHVLISEKIAPFSFLNYMVYNPNLYTSSELENILKHEKIHIAQWHTTDVLLANLNLIYQWFNPFAWIYLKSLQQNLEYIADSEAVKDVSCKKEYQKALLKISVENFNPALTNSFYKSFIKKRIIMLNNNSTSKDQTWKTALIFPVLLAFLLIFNVKTEAQIKTQTESTETTTIERIAVNISKEAKQSDLNFLKGFFDKQNIQLEFEDVQRSGDGFITGITVNFLNRNTNATGSFSKNDPDGIDPFEIYVENGVTGFADLSTSEVKGATAREMLSKIENNPLYIINEKEYTADELDGKTIGVGSFAFIDAKNAKANYGDKGKDGVLIIYEGEILDDYTSELKGIDWQNKKFSKTFIEVKKNKNPTVFEISINSEATSEKNSKGFGSSSTSSTKNIVGNPIHILNGKIVKKNEIDSLEPGSIVNTIFLVAEDAIPLYGKAAREGAILITTRPPGTTVEVSAIKFAATDKEGIVALYNEMKSERKKALIILDGKKQPKSFDLNSIDPGDIEAINVQSGKDIIAKYGKPAKDGVIFISTEKAVKTGTGTGNTLSSKTNIIGIGKFIKSEAKVMTITGESDQINASQWGTRSNPANVIYYPQSEKPLVVVDGKEKEKDFDIQSMDHENIESIKVLKGENATEEYGDKGKNGVIEIVTEDKISQNSSLKPTFAKINSSTTEEGLKITRKQLKEQANLDLTIENIKRNKEGLITQIKVTGKKGNMQASETYQKKDGIPEIFIGVRDNSIIISSNPPRK